MEDLLENPKKVTPRLLFELYTFNYQRTLFEKLLNDKIDDAIRQNNRQKKVKKDVEAQPQGAPNTPNLSIFVELLNIFDEKLLSDNSFFETRRQEWVRAPDKPIMDMEWILPENWKAEEKAFREGENEEREEEDPPEEKCGRAFVVRELAMWSCLFNRWELVDTIRDHVKEQESVSKDARCSEEDTGENLGTVLGVELGIAFLIHNCRLVTEKYITLSELQSSYKEQQEKIEEYTVELITSCYEMDYDQCLLLIRIENRHWGKRTALQLAEQARLGNFMSTDAVQDLLDKIWTGGLEPTTNFRLAMCSVCPLLVPFFMKPSKDPYIDRISYMKSGFFWGGKQVKSLGMSTNEEDNPSKLMVISNFCTSPLYCFIIEVVSYLAFLGLFAYVILLKFCIRITFFEYLLMIWMVSIQLERIRKFIAIADKTKSEKIRLMYHDTWNILYFLAIATFLAGIILRASSIVSYEDIYLINMKSFENLPNKKINLYNTSSWEDFQDKYKFSVISSFFSNANNPLYTEMSPEAKKFVEDNYGIYPFEYINGMEDHPASLNYCPLHILENSSFENPKFLKWAQIFYGITYLIMCMAVLHFYDIHKLLGPLAISIGRMMRDLMMFIFILAVFLVPYGVITTALLYPNEVRLADCMEGIFFKPILNLYGDLFLTEYTNYEFNSELDGCVEAEDIRSIETENDLYSGFDFVRVTPIMKNFTHEWERDIKLWNECSPEHMTQITAFYLTNYDCNFGEGSSTNTTSSGTIECSFLESNEANATELPPVSLTTIFGDCFSKVRVLRISKDEIAKFRPLLPTESKRDSDQSGDFDYMFQDFEGADMENYEYFVFSPFMEENILNENDPANKEPSDSQKAAMDRVRVSSNYRTLAMELYKAIGNHINTPVEGLHIFPTQDVYKFENEEIPVSDRLGETEWKLDVFHRRVTKGVKLTFNDLLPSCSVDEKIDPCTSSKKQPVVLAAMIVYSFENDKRRFNYTNPNFMSNIPAEGSKNKNQKLQNFKTLYFPEYPADKSVVRKDLTSEMLLLEYFHDDDVDYISVQTETEDGKTEKETAVIPQGIVHQKTLLLFYAKKFSRCPERYFVNSFFLGVYMMAANVMLINLLVALFATTYEQVQEDSDKIWKLNRFDLVMDYWGKDPIPTPLILVYHVLLLIKYIRFSFGEKKSRRTTIVCWPRIPGDHAVNLRQFPLKVYPPTGKDSDAKNSINSLKHNTIDSLINNLIDFEKVEVATAKEKEDENEEPKEVMRQMNEKLERLRASVLQLQTRLRKKNKDE